jgi:hypothetical protein
MKRTNTRKIGLKSETIRQLTTHDLTRAQGGMVGTYVCSRGGCDEDSCSTYIQTHCCPIL